MPSENPARKRKKKKSRSARPANKLRMQEHAQDPVLPQDSGDELLAQLSPHQLPVTLAFSPRLSWHDATPLDSLSRSWISSLSVAGKTPETIRAYTRDLRVFLDWCATSNGPDNWAAIKPEHICDFLTEQRANAVSDSLVARRASVLRSITEYGRNRGEPIRRVELKPRQGKARVASSIGQATFERLLAACRPLDYFGLRDRAIVGVLWYCGITAAECCRLDTTDLDTREGFVRIGTPSRILRQVPVSPQAVELIRAWQLARRPVTTEGDRNALWLTARGTRLPAPTLQRMLSSRSVTAGIVPPISARVLRNSFGVRLIEAGVDEAYVASLMGHSAISSTLALRRAAIPHRGKAGRIFDALRDRRPPAP